MKSLYTLILLAVASVSLAQDEIPTIGIIAEDTYPRDSKIVQTLAGLEDVTYRARWVVRSDDGREDPDIRIHYEEHGVSIWCPPGRYESICTIAIFTQDPAELVWVDLFADWSVEGGPDPPNPPDPPGPPDDPPGPPAEGFDDVPALVADLVRPIKDAEKVETCKILAETYRRHGQLAREGVYEDSNELAAACNSDYMYQIGINKFLQYRPAMSLLRQEIGKMMVAGRAETMEDFGNLWIAIGDGFDIIKEETNGAMEN